VSETVTERLAAAISARDIDAFVACLHEDYRSDQPAHPDRAFVGSAQARANWSAIFEDVPDVRADIERLDVVGDVEWGEWHITGTRRDGSSMEMRGVIISGVEDGRVRWAHLYLELVEQGAGIEAAVDEIRGA
jgi:ketosteroid isomerase-like protein